MWWSGSVGATGFVGVPEPRSRTLRASRHVNLFDSGSLPGRTGPSTSLNPVSAHRKSQIGQSKDTNIRSLYLKQTELVFPRNSSLVLPRVSYLRFRPLGPPGTTPTLLWSRRRSRSFLSHWWGPQPVVLTPVYP